MAKVRLVIPDAVLPFFLHDLNRFRTEQLFLSTSHYEYWKAYDTTTNRSVLLRRARSEKPSMKAFNGVKATLSVLGQVKNPFLLELVGFAQERLTIIFEGVNDSLFAIHSNKGKYLTGTQLTMIAVAIACAMESLARNGYIVRDLKPESVFLKSDMEPRLACFDHSHTSSDGAPVMRAKPRVWDSPEVLSDMPYDGKTDVYSYGMLLLFMATQKVPYYKLADAEMREHIVSGKRPKIPRKVPGKLSKMITACWNQDPTRRPDWSSIIEDWLYKGVEFSGTNKSQITLFSQKILDAQKIPVGKPVGYEVEETVEKQWWEKAGESESTSGGTSSDEWPSEESKVEPRVFSRLTLATAGKKRRDQGKRRKEETSSSSEEIHRKKRRRSIRDERRRMSSDDSEPLVKKRRVTLDDDDERRVKRRKLSSDDDDYKVRSHKVKRRRLSSDDDDIEIPRKRRRQPMLSSSDDDDRPIVKRQFRSGSVHEPVLPLRGRLMARPVGVNLSIISNITHPKWEQEMMKAKKGLKPDQYGAFCDIMSDYLRLRTDPDKLTIILDVLANACSDERAVAAVAQAGLQRVLPVDDPILLDDALNVLEALFKARADLFQDNFEHQMATIITRRPEKALHLLHSYARQFPLIENPWPILDLFLRNYKVFLKSESAAEYVRIFSFLNSKYPNFVRSRADVTRWVFEKVLRAEDKFAVVEAYHALADVCHPDYKPPTETILQDIKDPILASSALDLLLKCQQFPVSREIIQTLVNAALENAAATKVLISVLSLDGVVDILLEKPKWMAFPLPTFLWTLKLANELARFEGVAEELARFPSTLDMAVAVVNEGESDAIEALGEFLVSIGFSKVKNLDDVDFFATLHTRTVQDDDARPCLRLLSRIADLGYSPSLVSFVSVLKKSLAIPELRRAGLSALLSLSSHRKCAAEMVKRGVLDDVQKHCTDERDRKAAKRLRSALSCY